MYSILEKNNSKTVTAIVVSEPIEKEYKYTYEIKLKTMTQNSNNELENNKQKEEKKLKEIKLILNIKKNKNEAIILKYGDKIKFRLNYERPNTARNYMGFDYSMYLKTKKIYGIVTLKTEEIQILAQNKSNFIISKINNLKYLMKEKINTLLQKDVAGLCMGMLIGDVSQIDEDMQEDFRNSSLSHILAVSGSNVAYIIIAVTYIFNKTSMNKKISRFLSIILLIFFIILTGCSASVVRACIMAILMVVSKLFFRKSDVYNNLAISALILLIINPYNLLDIGFQLSYIGTIGIVFLNDKIFKNKSSNKENTKTNLIYTILNKVIKYIKEMVKITLCANISIIPIMMLHFNTLSLIFIISNILAGPILGIVVILGFIMFFISLIWTTLAIPFSFILNIILQFIIKIANFTSGLPLSSILVITPNIYFIISYYSILFLLIYRKSVFNLTKKYEESSFNSFIVKFKSHTHIQFIKIISLLLITIIILSIIFQIILNLNQPLKIYFIDVGQGDSCLIITPQNKKILVDGGGNETSSFDVGEKVLIPYLLDRKINKLDYIMISHFDSDHVERITYCNAKVKSRKCNYI